MLQTIIKKIPLIALLLLLCCVFNYASCKYSFRDASPIPAEVKTFRVNYLENKAQFVNAQLSPQLTESLKRKIINITRLKQTNEDDAHYDISGYVSQYYPSTVNITNNATSTNRLNIGFHLIFKNTLDPTKNFEVDITRYEDFSAQLTLSDAESSLTPRIVTGIVDEIFNKIFSNW
ncbi:LPS assembly lipoprotein LptE [Ferruginibacter yonginensis]|uniref:LPS assembly lipoprotein LptE n=1 Tax=Ferruginibacter yonginensis TaxID=1310416 RepID=A0ABV8QNX5_9BACT